MKALCHQPPLRRSAARRGLAFAVPVTLVAAMMTAAMAGLMMPLAAQAAPDWRRGVQEQLEPNNLVRPSISMEQCANAVRRRTGGRVLSVTPARRGDDRGCEVRVLIDGKRLKDYFVDGDGNLRPRD